MEESTEDEYEGEEHYYGTELETQEEVQDYISSLMRVLINKVIPEKPRWLTLELAGKCLTTLGKVWNLSEYPPANFIDDFPCDDSGKKLMDMEGYIDDYQYLHFDGVDLGLTDVSILAQQFIWLLSVDLSGNRLYSSACSLSKLPNLVALKLNRNRIRDPNLPPMKHLQYLALNSNQINSLTRIYHPNLQILDLNFNHIKTVNAKDCEKHPKLTQLELRGNELTSTSGIQYISLVNLYLAQNQITELKGLEILVNLQRLHLRDNPLYELDGFSEANQNLTYLNIRKCQIPDLEEIKKLSVLKGLKELVVKGNLFNPERDKREREEEYLDVEEEEEEEEENDLEAEEADEEMRVAILTFIPTLIRIDKDMVTKEEKRKMRDALYNFNE